MRSCQLQVNEMLIPLEVRIASSFWTRLIGLLGSAPAVGHGLLLLPCARVHTIGMRVPIDVAFLDANGVVLKLVPSLRPMRFATCEGASQVIETSDGYLSALKLTLGDVVLPQQVLRGLDDQPTNQSA